MGDTQARASWGTALLDDVQHPRSSIPFVFPREGPLPVHDAHAGIAFGDGGMRGSFHAGVIHALVTSGYFPRVAAGTSIGSLAGAVLCAAADLTGPDDGSARRALLDDWLATWIEGEPGKALWREVLGPERPLRVALDTLLDLPRDLAELGRAAGEVRGALVDLGKKRRRLDASFSLVRWGATVAWRLPLRLKARSALALGRHVARQAERAGPAGLARDPLGSVFPDGGWDLLQVALDALGLRASLARASLDDSPFAAFFAKHLPGRRGAPRGVDDFTRSRLVLEVANVSTFDSRSGAPRLLRVDRGAQLWQAIKAACSLVPVFEAQRARDVLDDPAAWGCAPGDQLVDAAVVQYAPLSAVIAAWKEEARGADPWREPPRRIFAVYLGPAGETASARGPGEAPPDFLASALRSLGLKWQEDLQFNARVVSLITQQVRAIRRAVPPEGAAPGGLHDAAGLPYLPVDVTTIAPDDLLSEEMVSAAAGTSHAKSIAAGCRATLQALHAETIVELGGAVACDALLDRLAAREGARARGYLQPLARACAGCTRRLEVPAAAGSHLGDDEPAPFEALAQQGPATPPPLDVVVPAGGVFRGVFQVGAVAGLKAYRIRPGLYAGASVGTLFSLLLDAAMRPGDDDAALVRAVELMQTLPEWVDAAPEQPGRYEVLRDRVTARLGGQAELLALRPRALLDALTAAEEPPTWPAVARALALDPNDRAGLADALRCLAEGRLGEAVPALDRALAAWSATSAGGPNRLPELIGFEHIERELRAIVFGGHAPAAPDVDLDAYGRRAGARFIFTATDHDRGVLLHFGIAPMALARDGVARWPLAVPAALAASSFPLAFRLRSGAEIDGSAPDVAAPWRLFSDGGILNNFPSDSALAYLRRLSLHEGYGWLATRRHRVLLLSLTEPPDIPRGDPRDEGLVGVVRRWRVTAEQEKIHRTIVTQRSINRIARQAAPLLEAERELARRSPSARGGRVARDVDALKPAIRVRFVHIAPAQVTYPHPFAYKPDLGFRRETQNDAIAAGCRRTRVALELERARDGALPAGSLSLADFEGRVRAAIRESLERPPPAHGCILGEFTPEGGRQCVFRVRALDEVYEACRRTALADAPLRDLVGDDDPEPPDAPVAPAVAAAADALRGAAPLPHDDLP